MSIRIWFTLSAGRSAPGTNTTAAINAFFRENERTICSLTGPRSTGSRDASGAASSPSSRAAARAIASIGKPSPAPTRTMSVASTNGIERSSGADPATTATIGTRDFLARRSAFSSSSVGSPPST